MKNKTTWLEKRAGAKIGKAGFETQRLLLRLTEAFASRMEQRKVRRADLARELGVDRSMITRLLNGDQNVTIKTLVAMASVLDCRLDFELQDLQSVRSVAGSQHISPVAPILEFLNRPLLKACSNLPRNSPDRLISSDPITFSKGGTPKRGEPADIFTGATNATLTITTSDVPACDASAWIPNNRKGECDTNAA